MHAFRMVETQHIAATMRLVDSAAEQDVLEQLLDASKPPLPPEARGTHYLLAAPFRYLPPTGSRFRSPHMPGIWYGADDPYCACAEIAYWRQRFLLDSAGTQVFPDWFSIEEDPFLPRGFRSAAFDAEGVATRKSMLVDDGIVQRYVLGSYSARKLGLTTTANSGGVHNLTVRANAGDLASQIKAMGRGLLVTELMGQGVNAITGDYSRGAAGFWVENGEIAYPVDGITIAGNLKTMFAGIEAVGSDIDPRSHVRTGSILVGRMTVAGTG